MTLRWLRRSARKASTSPSPRTPAAGTAMAATSSACPGVRVVSSPASRTDYYSGLVVSNGTWQPGRGVPPPLDAIGPDVMLAVATVRGPEPWQWREAAPGAYMAWPDAIGAVHAEEMTAAQLRDLLAAREGR